MEKQPPTMIRWIKRQNDDSFNKMQIRYILHKLITHRSCKCIYSHEIHLKKKKKIRKKRNGNNEKKKKTKQKLNNIQKPTASMLINERKELNMQTQKLTQIHTIRSTTFVCTAHINYLVVKCSSIAGGAILIPYFLKLQSIHMQFFCFFFLFRLIRCSVILLFRCCFKFFSLLTKKKCMIVIVNR